MMKMINDGVFRRLCLMASKLAKAWDRELFDSLIDLAYSHGIDVCWDDESICIEDDYFRLSYSMSQC